MDVFRYRDSVIADYKAFTTSFAKIKAPDIDAFVQSRYDAGQYWPAPLIQLNPSFVPGRTVERLCDEGLLDPTCADIFRFGRDNAGGPGVTARLHKHQQDAIHVARSLKPDTRVDIIYPMNALVNSQREGTGATTLSFSGSLNTLWCKSSRPTSTPRRFENLYPKSGTSSNSNWIGHSKITFAATQILRYRMNNQIRSEPNQTLAST